MKFNKENIGCFTVIIVAVLLFVAWIVWIRLDNKKEAKFKAYKEESKSYFEQKNYEKAIQIYLLSQKYASEEDANKINIDIAVCYDSLSQYENVIKYYDYYLEHSPDFDEVYFTRANTHYEYQNYDKGIEEFNEMLKQYCDKTYISKGKEYLAKHKKDKAIDVFLKAIRAYDFKTKALIGIIQGYFFLNKEKDLDDQFVKQNLTMNKDFYEVCQLVLTDYYNDRKSLYGTTYKDKFSDHMSYEHKWEENYLFSKIGNKEKIGIKDLISSTYKRKWSVAGIYTVRNAKKYTPNINLTCILDFWNSLDDKSDISNKGKFIDDVSNYISELPIDTIIANKTIIADIINKFSSPHISDDISDVLFIVGNYYYNSGNLDKAETFYSHSLQDINATKNDNDSIYIPKLLNIQLQLARVYYDKQNYLKAKDYYLKCRTVCEQIKTQNPQYSINGIIFMLSPLSYTYSRLNDYQTAINLSKERIELLQKNRDIVSNHELLLAEAFLECSYFYLYTQSYDLAEQYHKKAQAINASNVSIKINAAILLLLQGKYSQIDFTYYNDGRKKANDIMSQISGTNNAAKQEFNHYVQMVLMKLDELQKANVIPRERYTDVEKIRKVLNSETYEKLAKKQKNLGNDYYSQKNYDEAEKHYLKSLEIYEDLENTNPKIYLSSLATILKDIGDNYLKKKNYDEAEKRYQRCIKIREDLAKENPENHLKDLATILKDIGDSYFDQKQYDKAEKYYLRCLKIREELAKNDSDYFQSDLFDVLYSLSLTYGQLENYSAAIQYTNVCNEVLLIEKDKDSFKSYLEPFLVQNYGSLSWYYLFTKEYAQSEQSARRVLKLDDTQTWVKTNLAHALLFQDRFSKAEKIYKELSQIKREDNETFSKTLLEDFDKLGKAGAIPKERKADVEKIRKMLRE